jgi:hypothetical protein
VLFILFFLVYLWDVLPINRNGQRIEISYVLIIAEPGGGADNLRASMLFAPIDNNDYKC